MARPSKLTPERDWHKFAAQLLNLEHNESAVVEILRLFEACGHLGKALRVPRVERARFEYWAGAGRVDLLLYHTDGSLTVVEAKDSSCSREIVAGIGQVLFYESMIRKSNPGQKLRRRLVVLKSQWVTEHVRNACSVADVGLVVLPDMESVRRQMAALTEAE